MRAGRLILRRDWISIHGLRAVGGSSRRYHWLWSKHCAGKKEEYQGSKSVNYVQAFPENNNSVDYSRNFLDIPFFVDYIRNLSRPEFSLSRPRPSVDSFLPAFTARGSAWWISGALMNFPTTAFVPLMFNCSNRKANCFSRSSHVLFLSPTSPISPPTEMVTPAGCFSRINRVNSAQSS